jgi:hypothetical protein
MQSTEPIVCSNGFHLMYNQQACLLFVTLLCTYVCSEHTASYKQSPSHISQDIIFDHIHDLHIQYVSG